MVMLPYSLNLHSTLNTSTSQYTLQFVYIWLGVLQGNVVSNRKVLKKLLQGEEMTTLHIQSPLHLTKRIPRRRQVVSLTTLLLGSPCCADCCSERSATSLHRLVWNWQQNTARLGYIWFYLAVWSITHLNATSDISIPMIGHGNNPCQLSE